MGKKKIFSDNLSYNLATQIPFVCNKLIMARPKIHKECIPQCLFEPTSPRKEQSLHFSSCLLPSNKWPFGFHPCFQHNHLSFLAPPHFWKWRTAIMVLCACDFQCPQYNLTLWTYRSSPKISCSPGTNIFIFSVHKEASKKKKG